MDRALALVLEQPPVLAMGRIQWRRENDAGGGEGGLTRAITSGWKEGMGPSAQEKHWLGWGLHSGSVTCRKRASLVQPELAFGFRGGGCRGW